ncbi:MAG: tetratricopeptide repeat protein [Parvibaculaceae bacterium]|nr:tetratricopeptide repeat protein [Parvibaculaceae bacterium]
MSDIFREVDEELRRDNASALWSKYGIYVIGTAVGIVALTAASVGWQNWQQTTAESASAAYETLQTKLTDKTPEQSAVAYTDFEAGNAGYEMLVGFKEAAALAQAGKTAEALTAYERVAADASVDNVMRQLAVVKGAILVSGEASDADMRARLLPLTDAGAPWRNPARELLGLSAYQIGEFDVAAALFDEIIQDSGAAPGIRDRAHIMQALLASKVVATPEGVSEDESTGVQETGEAAAPAAPQ